MHHQRTSLCYTSLKAVCYADNHVSCTVSVCRPQYPAPETAVIPLHGSRSPGLAYMKLLLNLRTSLPRQARVKMVHNPPITHKQTTSKHTGHTQCDYH